MPLAWNEIKRRAVGFTRSWAGVERERAEAQTFWNEFFDVFGIRRRTVASFEEPVRNLGGAFDFIDLFWKGRLIAEHKSRGRDLGKAHTQAMGYIQSLLNEGREEETPRYIIVSDFARIALHDLEAEEGAPATVEFPLNELPNHVRHFAFIAGYETRRFDEEDPANFKATQRLANLHDRLEDGGYAGHDLQRFMVRVLFCLFAEDTGIFEPEAFSNFVRHRTREDGSDAGAQLSRLFEVLNTPVDRRQRNLDEDLAALPYVNGELFAERLNFADFSAAMRVALLECCNFRWQKISPAVFGSLFQNIMEDRERRQIGAHYTSERDILKLIRSLFLDDLRERFDRIRRDRRALAAFHRELGDVRFLDPACGCGNFLVIAYRELRRLELDILQARFGNEPDEADIRAETRVNVGQFHGIEIEEWPVRIAEVAMWLMDHQMNAELFERFGQIKATTPLTRSPHVVQANALQIDWNDVLSAIDCSYVLGNPPFIGAKHLTASQRTDINALVGKLKNAGVLDYVAGWYFKARRYVDGNVLTRVAFVSTNSICQGEQAGVLWNDLMQRGVIIHFAHRTFEWMSEARGRAHVHVVIVGWGLTNRDAKRLFEYEPGESTPSVSTVTSIGAYLVEGGARAVQNRSRPICPSPEIGIGCKPIDNGKYLFSREQRDTFLEREPRAKPYMKKFWGADDFLQGRPRYCLWLAECPPDLMRRMPRVMERVEAVRLFRVASRSAPTQKLGLTPARWHVENIPTRRYLLVPRHTSEKRAYIPMAFVPPSEVAGDSCLIVTGATLFHFGVMSSVMHMAWVRQVCGRIKSDYRYSAKLVYNNFPWPQDVTGAKKERVEEAAQGVLDARAQFPDSTPADLYDPNAMPPVLRKAHEQVDRSVDKCYRAQPFTSDRRRLELLFAMHEQLVTPLTARAPRRRVRGR